MARSRLFRHCMRLLQQSARKSREPVRAASTSRPLYSPRWTRRRFMQSTALAGSTAIATKLLSHQLPSWGQNPDDSPTIAIVGAGLAGLNAAYQLKKMGLSSTVYEAKTHVGGRAQSVTGAVGSGLIVDTGGHFINTEHDDMLTLADELGLTLFNRNEDAAQSPIPSASYYFDDRSYSETEVADSMAAIAQQIAADAALLDEDYDQFAPRLDQLSVAVYLDLHADKISTPFVRTLLEQSIRSEYGVEPQESSALQLLFNLPSVKDGAVEVIESDETYVVEGGIGRLIERLTADLSEHIQTQHRLTRIQAQGSGFRLTFNDKEQVLADYVILALPFTVLRRVDMQIQLPETLNRFIYEGDLGVNEKVFAGFNQKIWRQQNGFIKEIWIDQRFSQAWEATQRQRYQREGALTFFLGGNDAIAVQEGTAEFQGRRCVEHSAGAIAGLQSAGNGQFFRTNWAMDPFANGAYSSYRPGQLTEFADFFYIESDDLQERQDVAVGNLIFAGEHLSDEFYGYMNGAAQTGRLAAEVVALRLAAPKTWS